MNKIQQLIQQYCPKGVEFTEIGKIGDFYGGLTGKSKNDFQDGNAKFVTYMNVFSNIAVKTDIDIFVKIGEKENQNRVEYGDVLFTGSSETPDECGMSSVLTEKITEPLYLNSFCFGFRLHDKELFLPDFLKYLFRDDSIRKQIGQTASGVTRFNISKKRFAKVIIPIPPIAVQQEIAYILDSFTRLEAELEARARQYEYYRNQLLNFEGKEVEWKTLGEMTSLITKGTTPKAFTKSGISFVKTEAFDGSRIDRSKLSYVDEITHQTFLKRSILEANDILFTIAGATIGKIAIVTEDILPANTNQALAIIRLNEGVNRKYIFYILKSDYMRIYINQCAKSSAQPNLNLQQLNEFQIPIPPLPEQQRIVDILDKFDALVNDISIGLPAEIEARRKQYEYYRGRLLSFKSL